MPKLYFTNSGDIWTTCDRCGWDYPINRHLRVDPRDKLRYCIVGLHCFDDPSSEDMKKKGEQGSLFHFGGGV